MAANEEMNGFQGAKVKVVSGIVFRAAFGLTGLGVLATSLSASLVTDWASGYSACDAILSLA